MINKILGTLITLISIATFIFALLNMAQLAELSWSLIVGSAFFILVGVVVYRKGIGAAVRSYSDATPKDLR